ncbi:MAG TPA: hypothetical protein VFV99_26380, partial [Kofleriaceae bacterium]|nr:hypothetical protein [Kofleriaceae bacterium]
MARTFDTPIQHLDECVALVHQLVERQINAHWEAGILPRVKDQFSGTFVSGGEVVALLGGAVPSPEAQQKLVDLDAAISAREERIEAKLEEARRQDQTLPFDVLRRAFALTPTEQRALWILIALEVNAPLRQLMRYLVNEASRVYADVGLLQLLVYSTDATRELMLHELSPESRLFRYRLVEFLGSRRQQEDAPFLLRQVKVHPRVIELVHGIVRLDREVADIAELLHSLPPHDGLVLPDGIKHETVQLVRNALEASNGGTVSQAIVLSGSEGSGRKSLVYGAARAAGCSVVRIASDRLPADPLELQRTVRALLREAALFHAMPMFERIDVLAGDVELGRVDRSAVLDRELASFLGPVAGTCTRRDTRPLALSRGLVIVDVPMPTEAARAQLWERALGMDARGFDVDRAA